MKQLTRQTLKVFWQHTSKNKLVLFSLILGMLLAGVVQLVIPLQYKDFFNVLSLGDDANTSILIKILVLVLILHFCEWIFSRIAMYTYIFLEARVMSDLYNTCFEVLHKHSYNFFSNNFIGSIVKKVTRYQKSFEGFFDRFLWDIFSTSIRLIGILAILSFLYWPLALILFFWIILYMVIQFLFVRYKIPFELSKAQLDSDTGAHLADTITNSINIKLFGSAKREYIEHKKLTEKLFDIRKFVWNLNEHMNSLQGILFFVLEFAIFYGAIVLWKAGQITIGDFALLQAYIITVFGEMWHIGRSLFRLYESIADANEMTEILIAPIEVKDKDNAKKMKVTEGKIEFKKVNFSYHEELSVFKNFNLTVQSGEKVALIGPSGGGKSTVVKILLRLIEVEKGKVLIDSQDISEVTQDSLRASIALVPQDPILFHRSLMDNIRYGNPKATDDDVISASKSAFCHDFISNLPEGYKTFVGERGLKLSGGERQRVAIARAILKNSPILILDEATSSLDSESESFIKDALDNLMKNRTTIVIAHRLSTIMKMDRIIVLQDGKIVEEGMHEELIKVKQGLYQKLWNIQAGAFN